MTDQATVLAPASPPSPALESTPLLTSTNAHPSLTPKSKSTRWSRQLRANNILGKLIPSLILVLAIKGYHLVVFETGEAPLALQLCAYIHHALARPTLALLYRAQFNLFFWPLVLCWFAVLWTAAKANPPKEPPQSVKDRKAVYECDDKGEPLRCWEDECGESWKGVRTRHCKDCGVCRQQFDHHCAFMSACISQANMRFFLAFLVLVLPLIGLAIIPLIPLQLAAVKEVRAATWETVWMEEVWWSTWYSWAGGPIWRYAFALVLGYHHYPSLSPPRPPLLPSHPAYPSLATPHLSPHLSPLLTVTAGVFVLLVALAMILTLLRNAASATSAVQVARQRAWLNRLADPLAPPLGAEGAWDPRLRLYVPPGDGEEVGGNARERIVLVEPGMRLYDFGTRRENWGRAFGGRAGGDEEVPERIVGVLREMLRRTKEGENEVEVDEPE